MTIKPNMLKKLIITTCVLILSACSSASIRTLPPDNSTPKSGDYNAEFPNLKKGDTWDTISSSNVFIERMVVTVSNENAKRNTDYYSMDVLIYPKFMEGPIEAKGEIYKNSLESKSLHFGFKKDDKSVFTTIEAQQDYLSSSPFPLKVGKSWSVALTEKTETTINGKTVSSEIKNRKYRYSVESIEEVSIPLGHFNCFKILRYDDNDKLVSIKWVPKETKFIEIKGINLEYDDSVEMQSYKVH